MRQSKLIKLLSAFSAKDLVSLSDFVRSPYFNKSTQLIQLFEYLYAEAPDFNSPKLVAEKVYAYLYPQKEYDKKALDKIASKLLQLCEDFVYTQLNQPKNQLRLKIVLHNFYNKWQLFKYSKKKHDDLLEELQKLPYRNDEYYSCALEIAQSYGGYLSVADDRGLGDVNFQAINDATDRQFLVSKLKQLCQMKNREQITGFNYQYHLMPDLLPIIAQSIYIQDPVVQVWHQTFALLNAAYKSKQDYDQLNQLVAKHLLLFEPSDRANLHIYLTNILSKLPRTFDYYSEVFSLYKVRLDSGTIYSPEKYLLPTDFRNIILLALKFKEIKWAKKFLYQHQHKLSPKEQEECDNIYRLCQARIAIFENQFEPAQDALNQIHTFNIHWNMEERRLRLIIYCETNSLDLFDAGVGSFRTFLDYNKAKISPMHLQSNQYFITTLNKVQKIMLDITAAHIENKKERLERQKQAQQNAQKLFQEIENSAAAILPEKDWVIEKLGKLCA